MVFLQIKSPIASQFKLSLGKMTFNGRKIKGVLCDITGVLTESVSRGGSQAITGSVEALQRLKAAGICL